MSDFHEFLKTGHLGTLQFGMSLEKLVSVLGQPELVADNKLFDIFKYRDLQVTVDEGIISCIKIFPGQRHVQIPKSLNSGFLPIARFTTIKEFVDILNRAEVGWQINEKLTFDRQLCLATEGRVGILFDLDFFELDSIFVSKDFLPEIIYQ